MAPSRCRVCFSGRVQGVGFRATARSIAAGFRITGWVRNEPDGSVCLEVQGDSDEVGRFLDRLDRAMDGFIRSARRSDVAPAAGETAFEIRR